MSKAINKNETRYTIRFTPSDPRDLSPALYLSMDAEFHKAKLTSVHDDVDAFSDQANLDKWLRGPGVRNACDRDHLKADVVTLVEALRDLSEET